MDGQVPIGIAHRGFSLGGAENSLTAFQAAVDLGYGYLETDVRVSCDGVAVTFHDNCLDRVTNRSGRLSELTWTQISEARIVGREPIPRLDDVLAAFPAITFNLDVKSHIGVGPTLDAVRRTNSWDRVRFAAFSHNRITALRRVIGPGGAFGLSPREIVELKFTRRRQVAPEPVLPVDTAAQVPGVLGRMGLVTPRFIEQAHRRNIAVHVWTINSRAEMIRLLDLGVDGIITDRADILREVLDERGQWIG